MKKMNRAERTRRRPGIPPWRDPLQMHLRLRGGDGEGQGETRRRGFATFWREGETRRCFNLGTILREAEDNVEGESFSFTVSYRRGGMHVSSWRYLQERYAHWSIATHNDCAMSFRDGLEAIRSGNDDGSFTVIARHMAAEPERVSSAAFLLASSAWYVRAEDASAHDFFAERQ